jgi:hypothetical protein
LKSQGILKVEIAEESITKTIIQLTDDITKILRNNKVILSESAQSNKKMEILVKEVLKLQSSFVSSNNLNQLNLEQTIRSAKMELNQSVGAAMS